VNGTGGSKIICDPRNAPWMAWEMISKREGMKYWLRLLRPPLMGPWYRTPWCGWAQFWESRPWR
jgi:hypothetical protein